MERLRGFGRGRLQLVFAGKAHPKDEPSRELIKRIRRVSAAGRALASEVPLVYLADFDLGPARQLVSGVDVWLNTPSRPLEASGTCSRPTFEADRSGNDGPDVGDEFFGSSALT